MKTFVLLLIIGLVLGAVHLVFDEIVLTLVGGFLVLYGVARLFLVYRSGRSSRSE